MMKSVVACVLTYVFLSTFLTSGDARVSRSFKRGYILGYAKGLDDAKHMLKHVV